MGVPELHHRAADRFGELVESVKDDQWGDPTPCDEWDVRQLIHHLVYESVWTVPIMEGKTIAEVGDVFENKDLLGDDPKRAAREAFAAATASVTPDRMAGTVHLSFGDFPGSEYALQLFTDYFIHGWDLAKALGADDTMDPEMVEACSKWFDTAEQTYRDGGAVAAPPAVPEGADAQTVLLARFGRRRDWTP